MSDSRRKYIQPHTQYNHADMPRPLYGYTHTYIYTYLWSIRNHTHMYTHTYIHTYMYPHRSISLFWYKYTHTYTDIYLALYTTTLKVHSVRLDSFRPSELIIKILTIRTTLFEPYNSFTVINRAFIFRKKKKMLLIAFHGVMVQFELVKPNFSN